MLDLLVLVHKNNRKNTGHFMERLQTYAEFHNVDLVNEPEKLIDDITAPILKKLSVLTFQPVVCFSWHELVDEVIVPVFRCK